MEQQDQDQPKRKDSNKIYFLIAVILALLGTNAYLFFRDQAELKRSNERIVTISDEKIQMQTAIDKIEAELDSSNTNNIKLSDQMKEEQEAARKKIADLRVALKKGQLTQSQLAKAQEEIKQLQYFVTQYTADIEELKKQNAALTTERNTLKTTVDSVSTKATHLEEQNTELSTKVKAAAALKSGYVSITPVRVKNSGKEVDATKASHTQKMRINFTVVNNPLAQKGMHDVYMRIMDPAGNFIVTDDSVPFINDGEQMQCTYKTSIEFVNDDKAFTINWVNPASFQKGTYTVILYADGHTMGKGSFTFLK